MKRPNINDPNNLPKGYKQVNGVVRPRVTGILDTLKSSGLLRWLERTAYENGKNGLPIDYRPSATEAADLGSEIHGHLQDYLTGHSIDHLKPTPLWYSLEPVVKWLTGNKVEPLHPEVDVWSEKWNYCGTADLVAKVNGELAIVDWKTSKGIYDTMPLQVAAYRVAVNEMKLTDQPVNKAFIVRIPKLMKDKPMEDKCEVYECLNLDREFDMFCAVLELFNYRKDCSTPKKMEQAGVIRKV